MNKLIGISLVVVSLSILGVWYSHTPSTVRVYTGDQFDIPADCKHIALLGCTPNPTNYIREQLNNGDLLAHIKLDDFLDIPYLQDSFARTLLLCKEDAIDHLIIAYLPIYYLELRQLLGSHFLEGCRKFLVCIIPQIQVLIAQAIKQVDYTGKVTLIIPTDCQLKHVPYEISGLDERIRYLIKQFPRLQNLSRSNVHSITIINNKESAEDDKIIDYFQYEYLYEKRIAFLKRNTGKERFHAPKIVNKA